MNNFNEKSNLEGAWKKPFASDSASAIVIILKNIFSLLFFKGLNIVPLIIILFIIFGDWVDALILFAVFIPFLVSRFILKWFVKNHKDIKIKIVKDEDFSNSEEEKDLSLIK